MRSTRLAPLLAMVHLLDSNTGQSEEQDLMHERSQARGGNPVALTATIFGLSLAVSILAARTIAAQSPQPAPASDRKTAAQAYKNIQVLKDIPADQLIPSMQFISASLGVECDFCHVAREFDKDDKKPKQTARKMMQMMFAINQNSFDGEREVSCNTCHRGSPAPTAIPAIQTEGPKVEQAGVGHDHEHEMDTAALPSGDPVLARFIQAIGGEAASNRIVTRVEKGAAQIPGGNQVPIDIYTKSPNQRASVMHMPGGESTTAFNGTDGWISFPGRPIREMSASDRLAAKLDAEVFYPTHLRQEFSDLKLQGKPEKVGNREADVLLGLAKDQPPVKLYFDKDSGLLLRMVHYSATPLGLNPTQLDFADYRPVDGVKTPFRWTIARPSGSFTIQAEQVQQNVPIDDVRFVKPPTSPSSAQGSPAH